MLHSLILLGAVGTASCNKGNQPSPTDTKKATEKSARTPADATAQRPKLPKGWQEFKHPEGAFSIYLPGPARRPRQSMPSLDLNRPLQPLESRDSIHEVMATATQPLICNLTVITFEASGRAAFDRFDAKPRIMPNGWELKADRTVTWGGRPATEMVIEKSFPNHPRVYSVGRYILGPDRLYQFSIERGDRMPDAIERSAFFDSFVPGK